MCPTGPCNSDGAGALCGGGESDSQNGSTALISAAERGRAVCARLLIDAGASTEAKDKVCIGRCIAAVFFALYLSFSLSLSLCSRIFFRTFTLSGALVVRAAAKSDSQDGSTALICAASKGHTECARLLIDAGADTDATNKVCHR